jgi:uncharacterized repeat protein (TIGR01451 family)
MGDCPTTGCAIGTLNPGQSITVVVNAVADPALPAATSLVNTASATSATADPVPDNNSGSATTVTSPPGADLTTTMTGTVITPPGGPVTYIVNVVNNGPSDAVGVVLTDTWSSGLLNVSAPGCTGVPLVCDVGALPALASVSFTVSATADPSLRPGAVLFNSAIRHRDHRRPGPGRRDGDGEHRHRRCAGGGPHDHDDGHRHHPARRPGELHRHRRQQRTR